MMGYLEDQRTSWEIKLKKAGFSASFDVAWEQERDRSECAEEDEGVLVVVCCPARQLSWAKHGPSHRPDCELISSLKQLGHETGRS